MIEPCLAYLLVKAVSKHAFRDTAVDGDSAQEDVERVLKDFGIDPYQTLMEATNE